MQDEPLLAAIARDVLQGLEFLHQNDRMHRDLKVTCSTQSGHNQMQTVSALLQGYAASTHAAMIISNAHTFPIVSLHALDILTRLLHWRLPLTFPVLPGCH